MSFTRRTVLKLTGALGRSESVIAEEDDDVDLGYGLVPYAEQGYGGSASECFIATAAIGTSDHDDVAALRQFRDRWLLTNLPGRALTRIYYATSPPVARWIARGPRRRQFVRTALVRPAARLTSILR